MTDIFDQNSRSRIMAAIPSVGTQPEKWVRSALHRRGFRFRINVKSLPGTPDVVLRKYNAVVFINGCFWHQHINCRTAHLPKSRIAFWQKKFTRNMLRDQKTLYQLKILGFRVAIVWECALTKKQREETIIRLVTWLKWRSDYLEIPIYDEFSEQ